MTEPPILSNIEISASASAIIRSGYSHVYLLCERSLFVHIRDEDYFGGSRRSLSGNKIKRSHCRQAIAAVHQDHRIGWHPREFFNKLGNRHRLLLREQVECTSWLSKPHAGFIKAHEERFLFRHGNLSKLKCAVIIILVAMGKFDRAINDFFEGGKRTRLVEIGADIGVPVRKRLLRNRIDESERQFDASVRHEKPGACQHFLHHEGLPEQEPVIES